MSEAFQKLLRLHALETNPLHYLRSHSPMKSWPQYGLVYTKSLKSLCDRGKKWSLWVRAEWL